MYKKDKVYIIKNVPCVVRESTDGIVCAYCIYFLPKRRDYTSSCSWCSRNTKKCPFPHDCYALPINEGV